MHFKSNISLRDFIMAVKKCRGEVFLKTVEGDILNLRSTLSQYVFISMGDTALSLNAVIECEKPDDEACLAEFLTADSTDGE